MERLEVTIDDVHAAKLKALAGRMHVPPGALARSLLQGALDRNDPDADTMVELLDGIDGALGARKRGSRDARERRFVDLADL